MKLTDREKELAARALERMRNEQRYTPEELDLLQRYPNHTLAAAKYLDACERGETHNPRP